MAKFVKVEARFHTNEGTKGYAGILINADNVTFMGPESDANDNTTTIFFIGATGPHLHVLATVDELAEKFSGDVDSQVKTLKLQIKIKDQILETLRLENAALIGRLSLLERK